MANCEEVACMNVQSAICLHCLCRLCSTHIIVHGTLLLKEGDELCRQINELAEQLNLLSQQIRTSRENAAHKLSLWRQDQIDKIEKEYVEKIRVIQFRKNHLIELEDQLTQRLIEQAKEPLEQMQAQQSANSQSLQTIRQTIAKITRDSSQLELTVKSPSDQPSSVSAMPTIVTDTTHTLPSISNTSMHYFNTSISLTDLSPLMRTKPVVNYATPIVSLATGSNAPANQSGPMPTPISTTTVRTSSSGSSVASMTSPFTIKQPPTKSCKKLIKYFQNVSGSDDQNLAKYIVENLVKLVHVNNLMIVLLSFLEAWHSAKSPTVYNHQVLHYHIDTMRKYIKGQEHELILIGAIQVFVNSCKYSENKTSAMFIDLLRFFFDNRCLSKETLLHWYNHCTSFGHNDFGKAKRWITPFIDQLN